MHEIGYSQYSKIENIYPFDIFSIEKVFSLTLVFEHFYTVEAYVTVNTYILANAPSMSFSVTGGGATGTIFAGSVVGTACSTGMLKYYMKGVH